MKTSYSKIIKWTVRIFFIVLVLICIIPFPINRKFDAVEIKLDEPSYLEKRTIYISGTYYFNLLTDSTFKGQIFVPEYKLTSKKMNRVQFFRHNAFGGFPSAEGSLLYSYVIGTDANGRPIKKFYSFGEICSKPFFHNMVILLYGQSKGEGRGWLSSGGYCIVPSASNREEALKILAKYDIYPPEH